MTEKKVEIFIDIAKKLNDKFNIIPMVFGSMGLSLVTDYNGSINDIDILIPSNFIKKDWDKIVETMEEAGFKLNNEKEHEFIKNGELVAFGDEDDLEDVKIDKNSLKINNTRGAKFKELTPEQYLVVYNEMLRDNYRQEKLEKNDKEKIEFLNEYLKKNKNNKEEEYLNNWKRCQADFENYKKDQAKMLGEFRKFASLDMVMQTLPVLDNFTASLDHVPEDQKDNAWVTGINYIQKQLEDILKNNGVSEIETNVGDNFNPEVHEAVTDAKQPASPASGRIESESTNKIKRVVQKGYKIDGKVIRAARVVVK